MNKTKNEFILLISIACVDKPYSLFLRLCSTITVLHTEMWTQKQDSEAEKLKAINHLPGKSSWQSLATGNQSPRVN